MRVWGAVAALAMIISAAACEDEQRCDQAAVDGCYADQGCTDSYQCSLDVEQVNEVCVCLGDLGCDQPWYHQLCDDAPYDAGSCPICGEE